MLDFIKINVTKHPRKKVVVISPSFLVGNHDDIMIRGGGFYAVWNKETKLWSKNEFLVKDLVDQELYTFAESYEPPEGYSVFVESMGDFSSNVWSEYKRWLSQMVDTFVVLDQKLVFANQDTKRTDYVSTKLSYYPDDSETPAFDKLTQTLYDPVELEKILYFIGSVLNGNSTSLQKLFVLFGSPGSGKSTILNIIKDLFPQHTIGFEVEKLVGNNSQFSTGPFVKDPLIAMDHEGDLSAIRKNTLLNSLVSHDPIIINAKYERPYTVKSRAAVIIATNKPVMITDANSGLLRRLIDIRPSGRVLPVSEYNRLVELIKFEYNGIAGKCLAFANKAGPDYYKSFVPQDMIVRTNVVYNFINEFLDAFIESDIITLARAWKMYGEYCENASIKFKMPKYMFRDEFAAYWEEFLDRLYVDGKQQRSVFRGFKMNLFITTPGVQANPTTTKDIPDWLTLESINDSPLDKAFAEQPAQLAVNGIPGKKWRNNTTVLKEIDTHELHFVKPTKQHIVVDLDLKDYAGEKSLPANLAAAASFPPTYAELSKSGKGLHLHYEYDGDVTLLSRLYSPGIDVLIAKDDFSIRRKLSRHNNREIAHISSGLPKKEKKDVINKGKVRTERGLRKLIYKNLNKEIHPNTKPSIDFIYQILEEAYQSKIPYDLSDLKPTLMTFAAGSTNNSQYCVAKVMDMKFMSEAEVDRQDAKDTRLVFYDVEVFPNLLLVCWKFAGDPQVNTFVNPTPEEIGGMLDLRLIGFNNRRYDNHILYARYLGYPIHAIYDLSRKIIEEKRKDVLFGEAYSLSYADVYDIATKKQSLKEWEIDLGLFHMELDIPWGEPVKEELWDEVIKYCKNDVVATEAVFNHVKSDFIARKILAKLSKKPINNSDLSHISSIIFGGDRNTKDELVYTDLSDIFPGYEFNSGVSTYKGETVVEGGYVYARPGYYEDVLYMDIASMHPTSIIKLNLFGPKYTAVYERLYYVRLALKEGDIDKAVTIMPVLGPLLEETKDAKGVANALKLVLNRIYGYTFARFDNPFRDLRNVDNIVAKRGALFMVDLKHALLDAGYDLIHIKTDSIKIANHKEGDGAIEFVQKFSLDYGYVFKVEDVFNKMVLINDAVLIAYNGETWDAVGDRFARPYIYKMFTKEPITLEDYVEKRTVKKGSMFIRNDEGMNLFVGRVGIFLPVKNGGGRLLRVVRTDEGEKTYAIRGTKGYLWLPAEMVDNIDQVDLDYYREKIDDAIDEINKFINIDLFINTESK